MYFQYGYTYNKPGNKEKGIKLTRNNLKIENLPMFKFITLRMQALWPGMLEPNMQQINRYLGGNAITHHSDEIDWFPLPTHSLRLDGWAKLHFGMWQQSGQYKTLEELWEMIADGEFFKMEGMFQLLCLGIFQLLGKDKWIAERTLSILSRWANNATGDVFFSRAQ